MVERGEMIYEAAWSGGPLKRGENRQREPLGECCETRMGTGKERWRWMREKEDKVRMTFAGVMKEETQAPNTSVWLPQNSNLNLQPEAKTAT